MIDISLFEKEIIILKSSPIYIMSLGAKELFHSNFWAWLMDSNRERDFIKVFFEDFDTKTRYEVKREYKNRDITILQNGKEYIIENKLKSIPDKKQLEKYYKGEEIRGVLTGIYEPDFECPKGWRFVTYQAIADCLMRLNITDTFLKSIVTEYASNLCSIHRVLESALHETENSLAFNEDILRRLQSVRLHDIFIKRKAAQFILFAKENIQPQDFLKNDNWYYAGVYLSYQHSRSTITFKYCRKTRQSDRLSEIGIQIEANQFRLFLYQENASSDELFRIGKQTGWFFDKSDWMKRGKQTKMSHEYCQYRGGFCYQYFDLDNESKKHTNLIEYLKEYLGVAAQIIEEYFK